MFSTDYLAPGRSRECQSRASANADVLAPDAMPLFCRLDGKNRGPRRDLVQKLVIDLFRELRAVDRDKGCYSKQHGHSQRVKANWPQPARLAIADDADPWTERRRVGVVSFSSRKMRDADPVKLLI